MMPWQNYILNGFKKGEMSIMVASRNTGKSYLQDVILQEQSKQMSDHIDFLVLASTLTESGWTTVVINYQPPERSWHTIKDWADKNCQGQHQEHLGRWIFEYPSDATAFALKWL